MRRDHVFTGGLVSYRLNVHWICHRSAYFVDRILKGAKPRDLPIEFTTNLLLTTNVQTANVIGVTLPSALLARANEVIE